MPARLFVMLASNAPTAVILRRGPTRWAQLIRWDTERDAFEPGQWLRGRVYEERCDLSPDGTKLVYFALKPSRGIWGYTAVSRVPYFTALAMWPRGDTWGGGGVWESDWHVRLFHGEHDPPMQAEHDPPREFTALTTGPALSRHERNGWLRIQGGRWLETWEKRRGDITLMHRIDISHDYSLAVDGRVQKLRGVTWADFDHQGRLVIAQNGALHIAMIKDGELQLRVLADFNAHEPTPLPPPPHARRWR